MSHAAFVSSVSALAVAAAASASATAIVSYAGSPGPAGDSGVDAFGNTWAWNYTLGLGDGPGVGYSAWGTPGLGLTTASYGPAANATEFTITFTPSAVSATAIDETPSIGAAGYNEETRFSSTATPSNTGAYYAWTPVYHNDLSVTFEAPSGVPLTNGDYFFVNIVFNGTDLTGGNTGFSAYFGPYSAPSSAPEPSSWEMMLIGAAGLGGITRRRRRSALAGQGEHR